jgi:hypothetical protein
MTDFLMLLLILNLFDDFHVSDFGFSIFDILNLGFTFNRDEALLGAATTLLFDNGLIFKSFWFFFEVLNLLAFMNVKQVAFSA